MSDKEASINAQFTKYLENREVAGASLLIKKEGQKIFQNFYGYANLETGEALTEQHMFRLASMTKPVTAIAVMMLVEQGKLTLDSSIAEFLPDFAEKKQLQS